MGFISNFILAPILAIISPWLANISSQYVFISASRRAIICSITIV
jgi:hypothetical protein